MKNRQWRLASHPRGEAQLETWSLHEAPVPTPGPGQILVRTQWLSMDPYMRGRISPSTNYTKGVAIGEVMQGGGVGEVVTSNHPDWKPGDIAEAMGFGWQEYAVLSPDLPGAAKVNKVDAGLAPPQANLSWLGMPGLTAYIGLFEIGKPKPGDTLVVSAASGAVGQLVGQIGKLCGARVIGIAGSDEKLAWCRSVGFDETINYKTTNDMAGAIAALAPAGVDVFFDNTGGPIHDAVLRNLAVGARVAICGRIALANDFEQEDLGLRASSRLIVTRALVQGFIAFDWWHRRAEAMTRLAAWNRDGKLQTREDVLIGFERAPEAFLRMMSGRNFGKQLVRLEA
jgi:NADPH-dependent curcumin reductase CurA